MAMALSAYEHHQPKNESTSTITWVKDEPVSRSSTPHTATNAEPRFLGHHPVPLRPHRRMNTPPLSTASSSTHNNGSLVVVKDVSRPSSMSGRSLSGPISLLADVALGYPSESSGSTSNGVPMSRTTQKPTLPPLASIQHLDRRASQGGPSLQPIYSQQTVRDGEAGSAQRGVVATAQGAHAHAHSHAHAHAHTHAQYVDDLGFRTRRLSLDGQGRNDRSGAMHANVAMGHHAEHRLVPSATRHPLQPRPVAMVPQHAWHPQAEGSAWREFPAHPPGVAAPPVATSRRVPPPLVIDRPSSDSRQQPQVPESYWAPLGPTVQPRAPYQAMPRRGSTRGSGKSNNQTWTFVTEDPARKHFNHAAARASDEVAAPRDGESPTTNVVVARAAPSQSSDAVPRHWAPIGNSMSAFTATTTTTERGSAPSAQSRPPSSARSHARPHSHTERPESAGVGAAFLDSSVSSDSGDEHAGSGDANGHSHGHMSDGLPPAQGTRLRSSERLRKRGRDDESPDSESPLQPLSPNDEASSPELQAIKAEVEDEARPRKRTYVRRDAQRRKEQNAQAQKKFRWKKKAMAEQMSKDLVDQKRRNKELEARCAELAEIAEDKNEQLADKETLLGRLLNENGTLKRRLEMMSRRFGFDDAEIESASSP